MYDNASFVPDKPLIGIPGVRATTIRWRSLADYHTAMSTAKDRLPRGDSLSKGEWYGVETIEDYQLMLSEGWPEGVAGVEGLDGLSTDAAPKQGFIQDVGGAFPIVPRYLAGLPDSMYRPIVLPSDAARGLTLIINASYDAMIKSSTALDYAQSVMRLVSWLHAEQIDVAVYTIIPSVFRGTRYNYVTNIRQSGEVSRPERIAAILHTSFLRRAWFALLEHEYNVMNLPGTSVSTGGYGQSYVACAKELSAILPEAFSVIMLPPVGKGDPEQTVKEAIALKLRGTN